MSKAGLSSQKSSDETFSLTISVKEAGRFIEFLRDILRIDYSQNDSPEAQYLIKLESMFQSESTDDIWKLLLDLLESAKTSQEEQQKKTQQIFSDLMQEVLAIEKEMVASFNSTTEAISQSGNQYDKQLVDYMGGLATEINQASSLDSLKTTAVHHLSNMRKSIKERRNQEQALIEANNQEIVKLSEELAVARQSLDNVQQESKLIEEAAMTCPLTKVGNKRAMDKLLQTALHEKSLWPFCLAVLDVDYFKHFNDNFGHQAGDKVLITMSQQVLANMRQEDFFFRYAGDEFVIFFRKLGLEEAYNWTERVRTAIESIRFKYKNEVLRITISAGITQVSETDTVATLFDRADLALLESKRKNRNCVSVIAP